MKKHGCYPNEESKPGSKHILAAKYDGEEKQFFWTGSGWSSNKNLQWQTAPAPMSALGWKYVRPIELKGDE